MLMNAVFSIILLIHLKALNVSLCDENKLRKCVLEPVKTVSQEHTSVSKDKGVTLGG